MNLNIEPIELDQQGGDVYLLHQALSAFGLAVSSDEASLGLAGKDTQEKVKLLQRKLHISSSANAPLLDEKTIAALKKAMTAKGLLSSSRSFTASGNVKSADGKIKKHQPLIAFDLDLPAVGVYRNMKSPDEIEKNNTEGGFDYLGEAITDNKGNYSFTFFEFQYRRAERQKADIVVFALDRDKENIIGHSQLVNVESYDDKGFVRGVDIILDDVIKEEKTEYQRLREALTPFLKMSRVTFAEIAQSNDQINFTAREIEFDVALLDTLARVQTLVEQEGEFEKTRELLYGLARQDIELSWKVLFNRHRDELQTAIGNSADSNIIGKPTDRTLEIFLDAIQKHSIQHALDDTSGDGANQLNLLLKTALPEEAQRISFLKAVNEFKGSDFPEFWKNLHEQPEFKNNPELISGIQLTQQLHSLTNFQPLVKELQQTRGIKSVEKLIDLDKADWEETITASGIPEFIEGDNDKEKIERYAEVLQDQVNAAFPTQRIAKMIRYNELVFEKPEVREDLSHFFNKNTDFDFRTTQIHTYIEKNRDSLDDSTFEAVTTELMELQRLYQVSTSPAVLKVLRENKLTSAYAIANIPRDNFINTYGKALGGAGIAIRVHNRGQSLAIRAEKNAIVINEASTDSPEKVMSGAMKKEVEEFFEKKHPNYKNLFGSPDLCECEHCRSVFSPAAYLVELLRFLEKSTFNIGDGEPTEENRRSPYDYLAGRDDEDFPNIKIQGRRPDLAQLTLSCENTNTEIPYIDLSNEIMEFYAVSSANGLPGLENYSGEDTGDATVDELRANPQHTNTEAYRILSNNHEPEGNGDKKTAIYPFNLPFHQPLNVIRTYSDFLNVRRYEVMQAVNPDPDSDETSKRAISAEALGFSEEEYRLLVGMDFNDTSVTTEAFEYFGYKDADELEELSPVQIFMNRTGITYVELIELVKTRFINPHQHLLGYIEKIFSGTSIHGKLVYRWLGKAADGINTPADDATLITTEDNINLVSPALIQWAGDNFTQFQQVITLFEENSACNLDSTLLRTIQSMYENTAVNIIGDTVFGESGVTADSWSSFHYFIRLWKKLGWSIHEVDLMLASLDQNEITFDTISKLESVVSLKKASNLPLNTLATLWGNIDTYGGESLYKQLFLNKAVQEVNDVFKADAQGNYLVEENDSDGKPITLAKYQSGILAAFRISAEELNTILSTVSRNYDKVNPDENDRLTLEDKLSLENLSTIYRYVVLANAMKSRVTELCKLIELFDSKIKGDQLFSSPQKTIDFFKLVISIQEAGFKPVLLEYIFTGNSSVDSRIGLDQNKIQQLATGIRDGFHAIEQSYPQEPEILNSAIVAATLSIFFKEDVVARLLGIAEGTALFEAPVADTDLDVSIPSELAKKYAYDQTTGLSSCRGVMSEIEKMALKDLPKTTDIFNAVVDDLYTAPEIFINDNFSGILDDSFKQILLERPVQDPAIHLDEKLGYIYSKCISLIKNKLKREVITKDLSDLTELSEASTGLLIESYIDALIEDISKQGFSARYFNNVDWSGDSVPVSASEMVTKELDISWIKSPAEKRTIPQQIHDSFSVQWEAYIKAPASGLYTFLVDVEGADEVFNLYLDNVLILTKNALNDDVSFKTTDAINLDAGRLYSLTLEYAKKSGSAGVRLRWKTATSIPEIIPASAAYPAHILDNFVQQVSALHRAAAFIDRFAIGEVELQHFITFKEDFGDIDFNSIEAKHFKRIFDYTRLRNAVPQNQAFLTDVFALASQMDPNPEMDDLKEIVLQATDWNSADLDFLIQPSQFNLGIEDFKNEIVLDQLINIMTISTKTGLSAETIFNWGKAETDFENLYDTAQILKNAVKAKYSNQEWLEVAGGLSDKIREQQKQALISYLLVQQPIREAKVKDADGLFEHLLIDVQMGACMNTSRIVQASAAIQLFVNRILLNLEKSIPPDTIDSKHWEWMKNYRVWEANRRIILFPENFLEPEWRNDRSEIFKDLESHLLQNGSAEQGLRNFLMSMDEVANLDVCGMHQENDKDGKLKFLHVFGRTHNLPYKYFYRRWNEYEKWSAWETVSVDIPSADSGVHLIPVVWKGRLFLFWPEFMEVAKESLWSNTGTIKEKAEKYPERLKPVKSWEIRLAWSEYVDESWSAKQVSKAYLTTPVTTNDLKPPAEIQIHPKFDKSRKNLIFFVSYGNYHGHYIVSNINFPIVTSNDQYSEKQQNSGYNNYYTKLKSAKKPLQSSFSTKYLKVSKKHELVKSNNHLGLELNTNNHFFYSDDRRTYFVKPTGIGSLIISDDNLLASSKVFHMAGSGKKAGVMNLLKSNNWHDDLPILDDDPIIITDNSIWGEAGHDFGGNVVSTERGCRYGRLLTQKPIGTDYSLEFNIFYHPFTSEYVETLNQHGITDLMESSLTIKAKDEFANTAEDTVFGYSYNPNFTNNISFKLGVKRHTYKRGTNYSTGYLENICFDPKGANSQYNWELFFHAPLYIATRLSKNGKYKEAMQWFHYIFDPATNEKAKDKDDTARYWKVKPFKAESSEKIETLEEWFRKLQPNPASEKTANRDIDEWRNNPFDPHLIASKRPVAYMKHVVIKYIENLLAWGDSLFRQFTRESVYEAIQIYVIASHVLGKRPELVPKRGKIKTETYANLRNKLDDFGNALVELENLLPYSGGVSNTDLSTPTNILGIGKALYFCIPANDKLLEYWDTVADRLFKIRHCQDFDGVERSLALFAPAIDPAMLIQARSQGLSLGSILADLSSPPPLYRFNYLLQKANEFCGDVKGLGSALLSAIEKKDAEELGRLRASQETNMLERVTAIRERQVLVARANKENLLKLRETAKLRLQHYKDLLGDDSDEPADAENLDSTLTANSQLPADTNIPLIKTEIDMSLVDSNESGVKLLSREEEQLSKNEDVKWINAGISSSELLASMMSGVPDTTLFAAPLGVGGSTDIGGGSKWASSIHLVANAARGYSGFLSSEASQASIMAGYTRRTFDWSFQAKLAKNEIIQIGKQETSAEIQIQSAEKELKNHKQQIANAQQTEDFLRTKFSNQELYQWMKEQISSVYKQSYNLAYEMAKKAEKAYQRELGIESSSFVQYGYWDNANQGLVSGEKLQLALRQLENSFLNKNRREYELSKHISILQLDPLALLQLKATGKCIVSISEELFDMDTPGHYFRRIKTVAVSIPCVISTYASVNCTLRLLKSSIRKSKVSCNGQYIRDLTADTDNCFEDQFSNLESIVTSSSQNDSGLFETNLRDERYLPFENAGVISEWQLELPANPAADHEPQQFDYNTISDVILHMRYTAREGGETLRKEAKENINTLIMDAASTASTRLFSMRHDFPTEWVRFKEQAPDADQRSELVINIREEHYPFWSQGRLNKVKHVDILVKSAASTLKVFVPDPTPADPASLKKVELVKDESDDSKYGDLFFGSFTDLPNKPVGEFKLSVEDENVEDFWIVITWGVDNA